MRIGQLPVQSLHLVTVLTQLAVDLLQVLVDLVRVITSHDPGEVALRGFLEEIAELSVNIGLHVA